MVPIDERIILVTGATDGIGRGVAAALAGRGATVLIHGRDPARLDAARDGVIAEADHDRVETWCADFDSLDAVRGLADNIAWRHDRLDVLINNAGIGRGPPPEQGRRQMTGDGIERRFQVNHLAPFLLSNLLLPLLRRAAPARIVNVASAGQMAIDFDDVMLERGYEGVRAYCQSKLAMVMATFEMAARLDAAEITVNALHPGTYLDTKMVREGFGAPQGPVETGIDSEVHLATAPTLAGITGRYFFETREARADAQAYDDEARTALWRLSEELTGLAV